jgi:hypothetical protein
MNDDMTTLQKAFVTASTLYIIITYLIALYA